MSTTLVSTGTTNLSYNEVQSFFPTEWNALPECYQADSCLTFFLQDDMLFFEHDMGETFAFVGGEWERFE